ncbi:MAG TPA: asparagine synthase (glutamine-hydrolyzing) [Candidatus Eisenbacteria bacterium]|nr:asparagine synthase (glutamine-hydrolyzing) [Candidatus Eisenbacteria bacterium]
MCGIAGELRLVSGERASAERVRAMCDVMVHRGPDSFGEFAHAEAALGMRRLAIVDVAGGKQPLGNEDGSVQVVCNGEIYNAPALMRELESRGHHLRTRSDVEVIAHLYEEHGTDLARHMDGMFAFALWDTRAHRLILGRDRMGIKPLYVAQRGDRLFWGSEPKCLLAAGVEPELDPQALHDYLTLGYVPGPASIFAGVAQLPPGAILVAEPGRGAPRIERYWRLDGHVPTDRRGLPETEAEWEAELLRTLKGAVESHLMADVPLGVFLSGGVDSGSIVALMHELGVHPIRTFTIGFEEKGFSETDGAREVATRYGTEHHELIVRPDAINLLPTLVRHFDEPFADSSAIPVYHVSELARRHVTVVLSGEGGDEMLAGYETYRARKIAAAYARLPRIVGQGLVPAVVRRLPVSHGKVSFDYKAKRFVTGAYLPPAAGHLWWKSILTEDMKRGLYAGGAEGLVPTARLFESLYAESDGGELDRLQYVDTALYLAADILVKVDRMSMAHSLETRVPFLDRSMVELARRIPPRLRLHGLTTKYLLKKAMASRLPASVVGGKKRGFNVPMPGWLAGELRDFTRDTLSPARVRAQGLFEPQAVTRLIDEHVRLAADHSRALWTLLVLSVWMDDVLGATGPAAARAAGAWR